MMDDRSNARLSGSRCSLARSAFVGLLSLLLAFATACRVPTEVSDQDMGRAAAALLPLKERLFDALTAALEEGGPENAIQVCRLQAPEIAAELSVEGVRMGRTSHKLRNPGNAPAPWMEPLLAAYLENPTDAAPRAVVLENGQLGYVEPIYAAHFCLSCHGPRVDAALLETIRSLYPEDEAIGFRNQDFRGLFWVTMPL